MEYKNPASLTGDAVSLDAAVPGETGAPFNYDEAFSRNLGWVTAWEQQQLRIRKVAIAGMGGVGGAHLLTLARLGIGGFKIADMDQFEVANFNRQMGAAMETVGRDKVEVMAEMARGINPEAHLTTFTDGVSIDNLDSFLDGVDLFIDGLDFFAVGIRRAVFARCAALGIPAITAAPIGFGTSYMVFLPGGMTFEQMFRFEGLPEEKQYVNFATALTPKGFHRSYLMDKSRIDLAGKRGPSSGSSISLCAGVVGAEAVKILLGRGKVQAAPWVHQFDPFRSRWSRSYLPFGNNGPLQSLKRAIGYGMFARMSHKARPREAPLTGSDMARIIGQARWAPSGDNSQPWRFDIIDDDHFNIHIQIDGEDRNIYDFNAGQPTLLSAGFLLETARIAASEFGRRLEWEYVGKDGEGHRVAVSAPRDPDISPDPLLPYVDIRSVDRTPFRTTPLTKEQKRTLEAALGDGLEIFWRESFSERLQSARLNMRATDIRLRLKAAYDVHIRILDWEKTFSCDRVPAASVGLDPLTYKVMRWVMRDWRRVSFMNRFLCGTLTPRLQLDLIPGLRCAAHFFILQKRAISGSEGNIAEFLTVGASLQRFWLTATRLGLSLQPGLAPLCFSHYAREGVHAAEETGRLFGLARALDAVFPGKSERVLFAGRVGLPGAGPSGRSLRLKPDQLLSK